MNGGVQPSDKLSEHAEYIDQMLEMIPPKYYFPMEIDEETYEWKGKFKHNPSEKQKKKALTKELSKKGKQAKLDPAKEQTVIEIQYERKLADLEERKKRQEGGGEEDDEDDEEDSSNDEEEMEDDDDEEIEDAGFKEESSGSEENYESDAKGKKPKAAKVQENGNGVPAPKPTVTSSLDELRDRLRNRVDQLRIRRKAKELEADEKKERRLEKKQKKKVKREKGKDGVDKAPADLKQAAKDGKRKREEIEAQGAAGENVEDNIAFGNLKFATKSSAIVGPLAKKKKPTIAAQLKRVEKMEERMNADGTFKETVAWKNVEAKAMGVKVKDNKVLLKKTLKRETKKKEKSAKGWDERKKAEAERRDDKQAKRKENIKKRSDRKKGKNEGKSPKAADKGGKDKQGRKRAGFEGKKKSFINK